MNILIVEDETLLALELECQLEDSGHHVIGTAASKDQAMDLLAHQKPDFAFVDIQLIDGPTGVEIGRNLAENAIPFVFVTGNLKRIPDDFAGAMGAIEKPYTMNGLQNALGYLSGRLNGSGQEPAPPSLTLPPALGQVN